MLLLQGKEDEKEEKKGRRPGSSKGSAKSRASKEELVPVNLDDEPKEPEKFWPVSGLINVSRARCVRLETSLIVKYHHEQCFEM